MDMDNSRFEALIGRLERTARDNPRRYQASVLAVALLGFAVLGVAILFALIPALLLAALVVVVVITGGKALVVLVKAFKAVLLLVVPGWMMVKTSMQLLLSRFPRPEGRSVTREEAPALYARMDELVVRLRGPRIHRVLLTDELNAAICQHPRFGLFGWEENYLILGLPLLQAMSEEEALAVVAHEYGHLSGHHSRFAGFIYRFRSSWGRMQQLSEQWQDWGSRLIARLFRWYAPYFNAYTFVLARQDEYVADRVSAEVAGPRNAANALMRVNIATQFESDVFWPSINRMVAETPQPLANRSGYWVRALGEHLDEDARLRYFGIARQRRTDHLDTHPALSDRLRAIGAAPDEMAVRELAPPAQSAAEQWLGVTLPSLQGELDLRWQERASGYWKERHQHLEQCRQGLARLHARDTLTVDERWECVKFTRELVPDQDVVPMLNDLLLQAPHHASALYQRGVLLLERGDGAGIADLERLMENEPGAILPACNAAWRFYLERDQALAEQYRNRWLQRSNYEERVRAESQTLSIDAFLEPHGLDAETEAKIRKILETHGTYLRSAYLLRRVYKADPAVHDYVLAFETVYFTMGNKGREVVQLLSRKEFPVRAFIVHLGSSPYQRFRKIIKKLGVAPLLAQ